MKRERKVGGGGGGCRRRGKTPTEGAAENQYSLRCHYLHYSDLCECVCLKQNNLPGPLSFKGKLRKLAEWGRKEGGKRGEDQWRMSLR